jgi:hypothetical protein
MAARLRIGAQKDPPFFPVQPMKRAGPQPSSQARAHQISLIRQSYAMGRHMRQQPARVGVLSNQQVAHKLNLSVRTIVAHLTHIYNKLGVGSRIQAALLAQREGRFDLQSQDSQGCSDRTRVAPASSSLSIYSLPPCSSTMRRVIDRPSPAPSLLPWLEKGSKIRARYLLRVAPSTR